MDRDDNASMNLKRLGVEALCAGEPDNVIRIDVGQVMPERTGPVPVDACGDPSSGPAATAAGRFGSRKQEVRLSCKGRNP
jgi:hypothetical protein